MVLGESLAQMSLKNELVWEYERVFGECLSGSTSSPSYRCH